MSRRTRMPAAIEAEIAAAQAARRTAEDELGRLAAARPALLLDTSKGGDAALDTHDLAAGRARRAMERADALLDRLAGDLETARAAEAEAQRAAAVAKGQAAAAEYRRLVVEVYGPAAQAIADALPKMAAALALVEDANRGMPYAEHLDADAFRHPRHDPGERPPAMVEQGAWVTPDGEIVTPLPGIDEHGRRHVNPKMAGAVWRTITVANPEHASWQPRQRQFAPKILGRVGLPGADDATWLVRPL